jgi:hypothetical protein
MNSDFEKRLQDVPMREIPQHWKAQMIAATQPQPAWWREWLWPCPRAWAGLAAAWGFIFLLHLTTPEDHGSRQGGSSSRQDFAFLKQETEIIAQLSGSEESRPDPPPPPATTKPRSSRRVKQAIG